MHIEHSERPHPQTRLIAARTGCDIHMASGIAPEQSSWVILQLQHLVRSVFREIPAVG